MKAIPLGGLLSGILLALPASGAVYRVTSTADNVNAVITAGHAGTLGDPYLAPSLRSAVLAANANAGADTIVFDNSLNGTPITLTRTGSDDTAQFGDLDVTGPLTVQGNGSASTIIQAGTSAANGIDKIFSFNPLGSLAGFPVTLTGFTLRYGRNQESYAGGNGFGGAFDFDAGTSAVAPGTLTMTDVVVRDCSTTDADGGGVAVFLDRGGTVSIQNCRFQNNIASRASPNAGVGGGIFFGTTSVGGANNVSIANTVISNNTARALGGTGGQGGGLFVFGGSGVFNYQLHHVNISGNTAGSHGGGIYTSAPMLIDDVGGFSVLSGNVSLAGQGGALWCNGSGTTTLNKAIITGNSASVDGGGIHADGSLGTLRILYSRLAGNTAPAGPALASLAGAGTVTSTNNWWGTQTPAAVISGTAAYTPWLRLTHTASVNPLLVNTATMLTASILTNSAGTFVPVSNLGVLIGLPITFGNAVLGSVSSAQPAISASGTATAMFTAGSSPGAGSVDATVDSATATAAINVICPAYSGTLSGGGSICPGNSAGVTVLISGGAPPYTVTLNNGGGTMTSASPVNFTLSPAGTTTYSVASATDANGCPIVVSGSATVTVSPLPAPTITLNPLVVCANAPGNLAGGPAGADSYAWTILNGTITSATNLPAITYVAGGSGSVTLRLTIFNAAGCSASSVVNVPIQPEAPLPPGCSWQTSYFASVTFTNGAQSTVTGLAFDGTNYWSCSGGFDTGIRLVRYDAAGVVTGSYAPGLDFRSVFTDGNCAVLARAYNDRTIYRQVAPGVFTNSGVTLNGGVLNIQSAVVFNGRGTEYIAQASGVVSRWNPSGSYLGSVTLQGYGSVSGENLLPQNRGIAAVGDYWLTYNGSRVLSVWDTAGNRIAQATLSEAGTGTESSWSFSYCNGRVFVVDSAAGLWRGYEVCGVPRVAVLGAPGDAAWNTDVQARILEAGSIPQVDTFMVTSGNPVPTLADLRTYQAVLVYSDNPFNDNVGLGNALADYVDQGGGVVLATFGFVPSGGLSMQGRFRTGGYMPLTSGSQSAANGLTLVKDLPAHPILDGVVAFNGGSSSYHSTSIAPSNATLIARWSNGQPLAAAKNVGPGRVVGLNFYPPSSSARSDFWSTNTDGGRLMANALMWSGKAPPTIRSAPASLWTVVGGTVTFSVGAVGTAPLTYQWRKDGVAAVGATNSNFSFTATLASAGQYSVVVSNAYGAAYSTNATLTVLSSTNVVLNAVNTGWYDATGSHIPGNANYFGGNGSGQYYRDWFVFNIPPLAGPVAQAQLRIHTYVIDSPTGSETYQLRQVTTPVPTLTAGGSGLVNIYNDLGDGPVYAARAFVPGESGRFISMPLNQALRDALAAAAGGSFALGGELATLDADPNSEEAVFSFSGGIPGDVQLLLTIGTGDLPVVGYFTDGNPATTAPAAFIQGAGFAPLHIGDITTQSLAGLRLLLINESLNGAPSSALLGRLPEIQAWVMAGGRLLVHDRGAGAVQPNPFLLGTSGAGTVRSLTSSLDVVEPATTLVTVGPFGVITNASLDGGNSSAHGYVSAAALPEGARSILSVDTNLNQIVSFSYPLGAGHVFYSTIPLDCYFTGGGCAGNAIAGNLQSIYTPNVLVYLHTLNPPLRFLPPAVAANGSLPLLLGNLDDSPVAPDRIPQIRVFTATNLALPFADWTPLFNPLVLSNGLLRLDGISVSNSARGFFRATEPP